MAFMQVEPAAFLIGEKGLDLEPFGIPVAGFFDQLEVGDQIDRFLVALPPPADHR